MEPKQRLLFVFCFVATAYSCLTAIAQPAYEVSFMEATYTYYCGIVDKSRFEILDISGQQRPVKFQASSDGASIEYDNSGQIQLRPSDERFSIQVYGEIRGRYYFVGKVLGTCKKPPLDDAAFKSMFPNPKANIDHIMNFSAGDKKILADSDLLLNIPGALVFELREGTDSRLALRVAKRKNGQIRMQWDKYDVQSEDAEIKAEGRQLISVIPKSGLKQCTLRVFAGTRKIGEQVFRVVKK